MRLKKSLPSEYESYIADIVLEAMFVVHRKLGTGLPKNDYERCMTELLTERGCSVLKYKPFSVRYMGIEINTGLSGYLIVDNAIVLEVAGVEQLAANHETKILEYMALSGINTGLSLNFDAPSLKEGIQRFSLKQDEKNLVFAHGRIGRSVGRG